MAGAPPPAPRRRYDVYVRDRTEAFERARQSRPPRAVASHGGELGTRDSLVDPAGVDEAQRATLPPTWVAIIAKVEAAKADIGRRSARLAELHRQHLRDGADALEGEIDITTRQISALFKEIHAQVKELEAPDAPNTPPPTKEEMQIRHNVKVAVVTQANMMSRQFRSSQELYLRQRARTKQTTAAHNAFAADMDARLEGDRARDEMADRGMSAEQIAEVERVDKQIAERDAELKKIYESIVQLNQIFSDTLELVVDQGTLLDRIDHNIELAHKDVVEGTGQIKQAVEMNKKSRLFIVVMVLCLLVTLAIIGLVIKVVR